MTQETATAKSAFKEALFSNGNIYQICIERLYILVIRKYKFSSLGKLHKTSQQNMVPCFFIVLFIFTTGGKETSGDSKTESILPRYLYKKFQFGTLWQVYLPVMAYDIVYSSMHGSRSSKYHTLLDVTSILQQVIVESHPCRNSTVVITAARWRGQLYFQLAYPKNHFSTNDFRICGLFHVTYIPGFTEELPDPPSHHHPADKPLILSWNLRSNGSFAINLTVSKLAAPNLYGCADARLKFNRYSLDDEVFCPNWKPMVGIGNNFDVTLILNYHGRNTVANDRNDQYFTELLFYYQILDSRNFSMEAVDYNLIGIRASAQQDYTLWMYSHNDAFLTTNSPIVFAGEFRSGFIYIFHLEIQGYFTPVILRKNVVCNNREAELIFYDGYLQYFWQQLQPVLKVWSCRALSDGLTKDHENENVRGTIGILTIVVFAPKDKNDKHSLFSLEITWQAKSMSPGVFRLRRIRLGLSTNTTIHLTPRQDTVFEVIKFVAPKGKFVHLWFSSIKYISSTYFGNVNQLCFDGIRMWDPFGVHTALYVICSNSTAENAFRQYKENGLIFGGHVTIEFRQYRWMASISAVITATISHCAGYINLFPLLDEGGNIQFSTTGWVPGGIINMEYSYVWAKDFINEDFMADDIIMRFQRFAAKCVRIQLVHSHGILLGTVENIQSGVLQYTITSEDLTSPSHFMIDLSHVGNEIQWRNASSPYTLQLVSLDSTFTQVEPLHVGVWNTEAYTAQIGINVSLLAHASGLVVQVQDGKDPPPVCAIEHLNKVGVFQDMHLSGPCGQLELLLQNSLNVIIYKPYNNTYCCRLEGTITHTHAANSLIVVNPFSTLSTQSRSPLGKEIWQTSGDTLNGEINIFCQDFCTGIIFSIYNDRNSTHKTTLVYRASLTKGKGLVWFESVIESGGWGQVCQKHTCYILSINSSITTWIGAQEECQKKNATLMSISSDLEWSTIKIFFTRGLSYIGLQLKVRTNPPI